MPEASAVRADAPHPAAGVVAENLRGQDCLRLHASDGSSALVSLHGAQVLSWCDAGGDERFYLSDTAVFDGQRAIRGGTPVCFPQFANRGDLPKHGLVRNRTWSVVADEASAPAPPATPTVPTTPGEDPAAAVHITLRLTDDDASRALWPHAFDARLQIALSPNRLRIRLAVRNTGTSAWSFTAALHSYLRVAELADVRLHGLEGVAVWDKVRDAHGSESTEPLAFGEEFDRVYAAPAARQPLLLQELRRALRITQSASFFNTVVWNPAAALCATFNDMPPGDWQGMLCVEAACVDTPVLLAPGADWTGWQELSTV